MGVQDRDWYTEAILKRQREEEGASRIFKLPPPPGPPRSRPTSPELPMHPVLLFITVVSVCFFIYQLVKLFLK